MMAPLDASLETVIKGHGVTAPDTLDDSVFE
jgi:hypothetical protein